MTLYGRDLSLRQAMDIIPKVGITMGRVWQRTLLDALIAPRRFSRMMPEFRRVSDSMFHPGIATLEPSEIPGEEPIQMLSLNSGYGGMAPQDLYAVLRITRWIKPKKIFEFGTFRGVTTTHLALNSEAEVYTLDLPRDLATDLGDYKKDDRDLLPSREEIDRTSQRLGTHGRIHQLFGDSRTFNYDAYRGSVELVIVDACHLYDFVMSDSRNAFELLGETGAILWHDFPTSLDVTRAMQVLAARWPIMHVAGTRLALYLRGFSPPKEGGGQEYPPQAGD